MIAMRVSYFVGLVHNVFVMTVQLVVLRSLALSSTHDFKMCKDNPDIPYMHATSCLSHMCTSYMFTS